MSQLKIGNFIMMEDNSLNSSLLRLLPGVKEERIMELFGHVPAVWDEHYKPYTYKIVLVHQPSQEKYTVYAYAGQWRIGGLLGNKHTKELELLITNK